MSLSKTENLPPVWQCSFLSLVFQPWSELPSFILTPQFCRPYIRQIPLCRTFNVELCTFWSTHRSDSSLQKGKLGTASLPWGRLIYFPFPWQVVSISFQELLSHYMKCGPRKKKLLTKVALITSLLSHSFHFFLTNYKEQSSLAWWS